MNNKNLLILGASSDVGLELIRTVSADYDTILAHYYHPSQQLEDLQGELGKKIRLFQADFLDEKSTVNFVEQIKQSTIEVSHIVHLSSSRITNTRFSKMNWNSFEDYFNTQLRSLYYVLNCFLPQMAKEKYGKVVVALSSCTVGTPPKFSADYVTAKYAEMGFVKALAAEYAEKSITINAVSPSMMETKFIENISKLAVEQNAERHPLKRNAVVQDVVPMIRFLLSEQSTYITGQNIVVAGGSII